MKRKYLKFGIQYADEPADDLDALGDPSTDGGADVSSGAGDSKRDRSPGGGRSQGGADRHREFDESSQTHDDSQDDSQDNDQDDASDDDSDQSAKTRKPTKPDEMREAMAELARTVKTAIEPRPTRQAPVKLTPEQLNERFAVYNPDAKFIRSFFRLPDDATPEHVTEATAQFTALRDGLVKQAVTSAWRVVEQQLATRDQQIREIQSYTEQQRSRQVRQDFNDRYKPLADPKYDRILRAAHMEISDTDFRTNEEYFDALAKVADEAIRGIDPNFRLGKPNQRSSGNLPSLPRSGGGGGGGSGSSSQRGKKSTTSNGGDIDSLT